MHPLLFHIGPLPIHTYGFLIAIGFLVAIQVVRVLATRSKMDVEKILDLGFWCLLVGFLGARILFVITRIDDFLANPIEIFKVWEGGLVFLGGFVTACPFAIWYTKKHKLPMWKTLDILAPGLVIAHSFGRLGCLAAGCCYGKPTGTSFGIRLYSDLVDRQYQGVLLHPTQLYEAFALLLLFFGLLYVYKKRVVEGQVALTYLLTYPIIRMVIECFRGDLIRGFVVDGYLSTSQFISLVIFLAALVTLWLRIHPRGSVGRLGSKSLAKQKASRRK